VAVFWKRNKGGVSDEEREKIEARGWNACLDAVEEFLGQHSWVTEEEERQELFCDGCGASLRRKLGSMRKG
jgi:hypothetical protein